LKAISLIDNKATITQTRQEQWQIVASVGSNLNFQRQCSKFKTKVLVEIPAGSVSAKCFEQFNDFMHTRWQWQQSTCLCNSTLITIFTFISHRFLNFTKSKWS